MQTRRRRWGGFGALVCAAVLVVAACGDGDDETAPAAERGAARGTGELVVVYEGPTTADGAEVIELLESSGALDEVVELANEVVALPLDVEVVVGDAIETDGEPVEGPETDGFEILLPTQFVTEVWEDLAGARPGDGPDEIDAATLQTMQFFLLHEIGHVVVHQLDLPITGYEEDVADQFAVAMLAGLAEDDDARFEAATVTLAAAESFEVAAGELDDEDWWGEHTVDEQRFRRLTCLAAGSSPEVSAELEDIVPEERLPMCEVEYVQASRGWLSLLDDHVRSGARSRVDTALAELDAASARHRDE